MTIDQLVSTLQAHRANGHGQLEIRIEDKEYGPLDIEKIEIDKYADEDVLFIETE